jgi:DNA-binding response OmpR family regulator/tetratricopeptide (TPR) repeat protein
MMPRSTPLSMHTVLLVEPHRPTRELLTDALHQAGHRVIATEDSANAAERFALEKPDAVIVAVDLPKVKGSHPGALIRQSPAGRETPLIAIDKAHLGKAKGVTAVLDLRPDAYLPDATRRADLIARLEQLFAAASARKAKPGANATLAKAPEIRGDLKSLTLPVKYLALQREHRNGVLVCTRGEFERRIYFLDGQPLNFDSTSRQDSLGRYLVDTGAITEAQYEQHLSKMRDGLSAAAALVAAGALPLGEEMVHRLKEFVRVRIGDTLGMREGTFAFYLGDEFKDSIQALDIPALAPILDGTRRHFPVRFFATALAPRMKEYPYRTRAFGGELALLGLATRDLAVALRISGRASLLDFVQQSGLKEALSLIWFLYFVGAVAFAPTPVASADAGIALPAAGPPRKRKKPLPDDVERGLRDDAVRILTASYFRVLGLDIGADSEAVERAYHEQATRFHPDSYSEYELGNIEDLLSSVQDRIGAAYRVLSVEDKRKAYLAFVLSQREVSRSERIHVEAEIELKRGEAAMKRKDLSGAIDAFEKAVALNPREPEYYSYLAWATYKGLPAKKEERARAALKLCKKALQVNPYLERPRVISALIEDEAGDPSEARRILLEVLRENPESDLAKKTLQALNRRRGAGETS